MSAKVPPSLLKAKSFEDWLLEIEGWRLVTKVEKKEQAITVALALPTLEEHESDIRTKVFRQLGKEELYKETGMDDLISFLKEELGKDDLSEVLNTFDEFEKLELNEEKHKTINAFISEFESLKAKMEARGTTLPGEILAFKLIRKSGCDQRETVAVMSELDLTNKTNIYKKAKEALKKYKGELVTGGPSKKQKTTEAVNVAESEEYEAFWTRQYGGNWRGGYRGARGSRGQQYGKQSFGGGGRGNTHPHTGGRGSHQAGGGRGQFGGAGYTGGGGGAHSQPHYNTGGRPINPKDQDGNFKRCNCCDSIRHLIKDCPDSYENQSKQMETANVVEDVVNVVLFTGSREEENTILAEEGRNCAVIDTACSSTVMGLPWKNFYFDTCLSEKEKKELMVQRSCKRFRFGGGTVLPSLGRMELPVSIAGKRMKVAVDFVKSNIPLLLSLKTMKSLQTKLDLEDDTATILGKKISLNYTSSGHYCIPLKETVEVREIEGTLKDIYMVDLNKDETAKKRPALLKLHRQFGHASKEKLSNLLKNANVYNSDVEAILEDICKNCQICAVHARKPDKPAVGLPLATRFNQVVSMDLKKWGSQHILHMVDMFTRYSISALIPRKLPSCVINKVMTNWISIFGVMEKMMFDNGGEFTAQEMTEVASYLNVEILTTGAESPFQNGLNERIHSVTDSMLKKMEADHPNVSLEVNLAWASMARNNLQMWHGFSSNQLVFGHNSNLPNILTAGLPALENKDKLISDSFKEHIDSMQAARKAFMQTDADERLRRALRTKMRASEERYTYGDKVYYFREGKETWLGPAKVLFQDGKVIFIRHGSEMVRVSANRLKKVHPNGVEETTNKNDDTDAERKDDTDTVEKTSTKATTGEERLLSSSDEDSPVPVSRVGRDNSTGEAKEKRSDNPIEQNDVPDTFDAVESEAPASNSTRPTNERSVKTKTKAIDLKKNEVIKFQDKPGGEWVTARVEGRAGKMTGGHKNYFNIQQVDGNFTGGVNLDKVSSWEKAVETEQEVESVNMVLVPTNRHGEKECKEAKTVEIEKLKNFGIFESVEDEGQSRISTKWVLWWKDKEIRARLTARGFEEEQFVESRSPTVSKRAFRAFLAVSQSRNFRIKTTDIKSAFLQSDDLSREVYIEPPKEVKEVGKIWKLVKPLYGLNDASLQFYNSVKSELIKLGMKQSKIDPALFFFKQVRNGEEHLDGSIALHVDDFLHAGCEEFDEKVMNKLRLRFKAGKLETGVFKYVGYTIDQKGTEVTISQEEYVSKVHVPTVTAIRARSKNDGLSNEEHTEMRAITGALNWIARGTRPDLAFEVTDLSTKFKQAKVEDLLRANKIAIKVKHTPSLITFPCLGDVKKWSIKLFTDASKSNMSDKISTARGFLVFLVGEGNRSCLIHWECNKVQRVVRSTLAAEGLALCDGLSSAILLRRLVQEYLGITEEMIPIDTFTDNKSLFEAVHSTKLVQDDLLLLDIAAIKQLLEKKEVRSVRWIPGNLQLADCLTKRGAAGQQLRETIQSGRLDVPGLADH